MKNSDIPQPKPTRAPYRYFGPEVWALVREAYLAGESARQIHERLGPSVSSIRRRAWKEGWTKRSIVPAQDALIIEAAKAHALKQASGPVATPTPEPVEPRVAARTAMAEAAKLMKLGRMSSAFEAARIADLLARTADRLTDGSEGPHAGTEDDEAAFEAVRAKVLGDLSPVPEGEAGVNP